MQLFPSRSEQADLYVSTGDLLAISQAVRGRRPIRFLSCDWTSHTQLNERKLPVSAWAEYFPVSQVQAYEKQTLAMAQTWYSSAGQDFTQFHGVSLGKAQEWMLWVQTLLPTFKFLASFMEAAACHSPEAVYCDADVPRPYRDALSCAQKKFGFQIVAVPSSKASRSSLDYRGPLSTYSLCRQWTLRLLNLASNVGRGRDPRPRLLLSYYSPLGNLVDRLLATDSPFRPMLLESFPKDRLPALLKNGGRFWVAPHTPSRLDGKEKSDTELIATQWEIAKALNDYSKLFSWQGVSLWPSMEPLLDDFVNRQVPTLAWACLKLEEEWQREPPSLVVAAYDGAPLQQMAEQLARLRHTPTAIVLHGLPMNYNLALENRSPSNFLVWGQEQAELYGKSENNPKGRKVIVAGNPHFDSYAGKADSAISCDDHIREVLVLTHPMSSYDFLSTGLDTERYALTTIDAAVKATEWRVTLKLHPCESLPYYQDLLRHLKGRIRIFKDRSIAECLRDCDLVIGPFSTVLVEAMLLGKPILPVNLSRVPFPPPFDGSWGLGLITSAAALAEALQRFISDPKGARQHVCAAYPKILENFAGPTDGSATQKVLSILQQIAEERNASKP